MFDPNRLLPQRVQRMHQREMRGAGRQHWTGDHPRVPEHGRLPRLQRRDLIEGQLTVPHDVISTCPVCEHELDVTRLHCRECGTTLEGEFSVGRFGRLTRDQLALLESFLRARGNLRDMERELGISYPTVRGRVDALVRALGLAAATSVEAVETEQAATGAQSEARRAILERLSRREMSADEAAAALKDVASAREVGEVPA